MPDLQWKKLKEIVDQSDNIVFFGGAGVSTESGIPDFRSTDGLYHQEYRYPARDDFEPYLFSAESGRILPVLPCQDAGAARKTKRCA